MTEGLASRMLRQMRLPEDASGCWAAVPGTRGSMMTAPRRAIRPDGPSAKVVVAVVIAALVALGGGAAWLLSSTRGGSSAGSGPGSAQSADSAPQQPGDPTSIPPAGSTATSAHVESSASAASTTGTGQQALENCRAQIGKVQTVIDAASVGIDHWRRHVQAQTDRFDGRIDETRMRAEFAETKLAGPEDVRRYDAAIAANTADAGGCQPPQAAPAELAGQLEACRRRFEVLKGGLGQADTTMNDWKTHLADMQRSASGQVPHAQDVWLEAWRKAPPNLQAWAATQRSIASAPAC